MLTFSDGRGEPSTPPFPVRALNQLRCMEVARWRTECQPYYWQNDGDWGNNRFLKLFPRTKLAFPPSYWQCRRKDMFLLGVRTLFYMAETQLLSASTFGLLKGSRKMCYESPMLCPKLSNEKIWGSLCGGISKGTGVFRENFSSGRPWSGR